MTSRKYIPAIVPKDADEVVHAKNDFMGWILEDIMSVSTFAGVVNEDQSWAVEIKIPWNSMIQFFKPIFPSKSGEMVGFSVLFIDYDADENGTIALCGFACNYPAFPWESNGVYLV